MGSFEDLMTSHARATLDMSGEPIEITNYTFTGRDPDEGTKQFASQPPFTVQGKVLGESTETADVSGEKLTGEYTIYVGSDVDIRDGTSDTSEASIVVDTDGRTYEITFVTDEHNGLYRCGAEFEKP